MPISLFGEPPDLAAESRSRISDQAEDVNTIAHRIQWLRDEVPSIDQRLQDLRDRHPDFSRNQGRHVAAAVLGVFAFFASWIVDFIVLAPLADFMLDWANIPANHRMPIRIAFAFIWTVFGYGIGAKLGIGFRGRQRAIWFDLVPALAYVIAMPTIAYFVAAPVFEGPARWMLQPFSWVLSSFPVFSGYYTATAIEYLVFLCRITAGDRRKSSVRREANQRGEELLRLSQRLAAAVDEHRRRFNELVQPMLSELAQQLIREFSRGDFTVTMDQPRPLPPPPQPLPAANGNAAAQAPEADNEAQPVQAGQATSTGNGHGTRVSPENGNPPNDETEFLRRQREQRAAAEDGELTPPHDFTTRLP